MMSLTTRSVTVIGFQIPQRIASFARTAHRTPRTSTPLPPQSSVVRTNSVVSTSQHRGIGGGIRSSPTTLFHARRPGPSYGTNTNAAETSLSPTVEISPSDHGTVPLTSFDRRRSKIMPLDKRLVQKLKNSIGASATPTPIQAHAIPLLLQGHDVMASSPTGSGKSIMFGLPLLQKLVMAEHYRKLQEQVYAKAIFGKQSKSGRNRMGTPRALVISPTRELASQTAVVLKSFVVPRSNSPSPSVVELNVCLATGGSGAQKQRTQIQQLPSCDILVGTPGRIVQYLTEGKLALSSVDYLVIDEADRLLDLGFEDELTHIARSLKRREQEQQQLQQSILCSATFPPGVQRLAADFLKPNYYFVSVGKVGSTQSKIKQSFQWVNTNPNTNHNRNNDKNYSNKQRISDPREDAVVRIVQGFWKQTQKTGSKQSGVIVFANTKDKVEKYGQALTNASNRYKTGKAASPFGAVRIIHGDKPQALRDRAIEDFKSGRASTLVATDVAARGLDISTIGLVVQASAPRDIDTYTHRVGRTGRAGASGEAITLLDDRSGFRIASGLVDLLEEANQGRSIPLWLHGMAHINSARRMDEEMAIEAGMGSSLESSNNEMDSNAVTNEEFTGQDFRRTAVAGSYGAGRDTSYRAFDEEAYSDSGSDISVGSAFTEATEDETIVSFEETDDKKDDGTDAPLDEIFDEKPVIENNIDSKNKFQRKRPSRQLLQTIRDLKGPAKIADVPDRSLLNSLSKKGRGNQKMRFEYLGMFPFDLVYPLLKSQSSKSNGFDEDGQRMPRVLMVAEKPSIAKAMAEALSGRRGPRKRRGISKALPVFEFVSDSFQPVNDTNDGKPTKCLVTVTSVVGHIFCLGFDNQGEQIKDPREYFHLPVVKQEESTCSKLRVIDHLRALAGESDHLVLWLDCDPEGENIAHEVMAITRQAINNNNNNNDGKNRIHRARFSAISPPALRDAFGSLEEPDPALSRAVDARQELDLRIGVALTRLLTWKCVGIARKRFGEYTRVISYGPCQTPALSFCVNRAREIEEFIPEPYWKVDIEVGVSSPGSSGVDIFPVSWKVPKEHAVIDTRSKKRKKGHGEDSVVHYVESASHDKKEAQRIFGLASSSESFLVVKQVQESSESIPPPLGLNTVALLEAGSKSMGMSPKTVMNIAEKLYSAGFISYPRTETTKYNPNGFDVRNSLRDYIDHPEWGRTAGYLLRSKYSKSGKPPQRGRDVGDHPPITPLRAATREQVGGGSAWRVYEFVVQNYLGSLHNELSFTRKTVSLSVPFSFSTSSRMEATESDFELELVTIDSIGFADCCRWVLRTIGGSANRDKSSVTLKEGDMIPFTKAKMDGLFTRPPPFLQEHELVSLMDENGIGTDASMAVHVSNIVDRGYVSLYDESGDLLRGPRKPGSKRERQIGRYMVPTALGMGLLDIFDRDERFFEDVSRRLEQESPALLSHPSIRSQIEDEVKQIAKGTFEKDYCLEKNLDWFEERYLELEQSLDRKRIKEFGKSLTARRDDINRWKDLGAFEPKKKYPQPLSNNRRQAGRGSSGPPKARRKNTTMKRNTFKNNGTKPKRTFKGSSGPPKARRKKTTVKRKTHKTNPTNKKRAVRGSPDLPKAGQKKKPVKRKTQETNTTKQKRAVVT